MPTPDVLDSPGDLDTKLLAAIMEACRQEDPDVAQRLVDTWASYRKRRDHRVSLKPTVRLVAVDGEAIAPLRG
jgi:hypothetical protein